MASCTPIAAGKTAPLAQWKKLAGEDCQEGFARISWQGGDFINTTQELVQIRSEVRTYSVSFQVLEALVYIACVSKLLICKNPRIYFPFSNPISLKEEELFTIPQRIKWQKGWLWFGASPFIPGWERRLPGAGWWLGWCMCCQPTSVCAELSWAELQEQSPACGPQAAARQQQQQPARCQHGSGTAENRALCI